MFAPNESFKIPLTEEEENFIPEPELSPVDRAYENLMEEIGQVVEQHKDQPYRLEFNLTPLVKPYLWTAQKALAAFQEWKAGKSVFEPEDVKTFLNRTQPDRKWLIPGRIPEACVSLFYADSGCGKTTFVYNLIKHLANGTPYSGYPVKKTKCLILQSDEPPVDTNDNMTNSGYRECIDDDRVWIEHYWDVTQLEKTVEWIAKNGIGFVLIDSLTGINLGGDFDENSPRYANIIKRLTEVAGKYGCHIMFIHHAGHNGKARGSSAVKAAVSYVMHLRKGDPKKRENLKSNQRLLHIEKSRAGNDQETYLLEMNYKDYSWMDYGVHGDQNPHIAQLRKIVYEIHSKNPGRSFTAEALRQKMLNAEPEEILAAQRDLKRLGYLTCEYEIKQGSKGGYKVAHFTFPINETLLEELGPTKQAMLEATTPEDIQKIEEATTEEVRRYIYNNMMDVAELAYVREMGQKYKAWKAEQPVQETEEPPIEFEMPEEDELPRLRLIQGGVDSAVHQGHNNSSHAEQSSLVPTEEAVCKVGDRIIRNTDGKEVAIIDIVDAPMGKQYWCEDNIPVEARDIDGVLS